MPRIDPQSRSFDPARVGAELDRARELLTRADTAPKNGVVQGSGWDYEKGGRNAGELEAVRDELARAVFDYVDFASFGGHLSAYGKAGRGDYMEGGLGRGFTLRPKHMTDQRYVRLDDIDRGIREIHAHLTNRVGQADLVQNDLDRIAARAQTAGIGGGQAVGALFGEIYAATDRLLEQVSKQAGAKELRVGKDDAPLTHEELLQSLDPNSLEFLIADEVLRGSAEADGGKEHWMSFFADAVREIELRRQVFRIERPSGEAGLVGDTLQHYLLVVGKRAKQTELLARIEQALGK